MREGWGVRGQIGKAYSVNQIVGKVDRRHRLWTSYSVEFLYKVDCHGHIWTSQWIHFIPLRLPYIVSKIIIDQFERNTWKNFLLSIPPKSHNHNPISHRKVSKPSNHVYAEHIRSNLNDSPLSLLVRLFFSFFPGLHKKTYICILKVALISPKNNDAETVIFWKCIIFQSWWGGTWGDVYEMEIIKERREPAIQCLI